MASSSKTAVGMGCVTLFSLPFLGFGLWMTWKLITMLWLSVAASGWAEAQATITKVELVTSRSDDGTSQRVEAEYAYDFAGRRYEGDQVGLQDTADNISSYHRKTYDRLKQAQDAERPVVCYVDPSDPQRALLDRELRPILVMFHLPFVLCFTGIGIGLPLAAWWGMKGERRREKLKVELPAEPWRWRDDWTAGRIKSGGKAAMIATGGFAGLWNAISLPMAAIFLSGEKEAPWWVVPIILLFPAVGIGFLYWFWCTVARWRRFGESVFRMASVPGVVGGELAGVILASAKIEPAGEVALSLRCQRTTGSGKHRRTTTVWEDQRVVNKFLDAGEPGRVGVPVRFVIPSDAQPTNPDDDVAWKLKAGAELPGVDYEAEFEVPVYYTEDSREGVEPGADELSEYEAEQPLEELLADEGVRVEPLGAIGSVRYVSPPFRWKGMALFLTAFTLVWTAISVGLLMNEIGFIGSVFALFSVVMLYACLDAWLAMTELTIVGERWSVRNGWYGFRGAAREFARSEITAIQREKGMSEQSGSNSKQWNHVVAKLAGGEKVKLVRSISNRLCERKLIAELRRRAGEDER